MIKAYIFSLAAILVSLELSGQTFFNNKYNRRYVVSAGSGISSYYGDLNSPKDKLDFGVNLFGGLQYMVSPQFGVRLEFGYFRLAGQDSGSRHQVHVERNLSFRSNNLELALHGVYNIMPGGSRFYQRQVVNPFVTGGVGILKFNPRAEYQGKTYALRRLQTEGDKYGQFTPVIIIGGGARIMINPFINGVIEIGYRKSFTDYLDDVSTVHVDKATFLDPVAVALSDRAAEAGYPPREAGTIRGNSDRKDAYLLINAKIEYYLPYTFLNKPGSNGGKRKIGSPKPGKRKRPPGGKRPGRLFNR